MRSAPRNVYFDCNAFDRVALNPSLCSRLTEAVQQGQVTLCLSPINVEELYGIAGQPGGRSRAENILVKLMPCFYQVTLREAADIFDQAGHVVKGDQDKIHYFYSLENRAYRTANALLGISKVPKEELAVVLDHNLKTKKDGRRLLKALRAELPLRVGARPDLHPGLTFEEFLERASNDRDLGFRVSSPLRHDPHLLAEARQMRIEPLETISRLIVYQAWTALRQKGRRQRGSSKFGFADLQQAAYLPIADRFVTDDRRFRDAVSVTTPRYRNIVTDSEGFVDWIDTLGPSHTNGD